MSAPLEAFLARLYTDAEARRRFFADARGEAARAGLAPGDAAAVASVDRVGLELAARSFATKRARSPARPGAARAWTRWWRRLTGGG